jgi:putative membrane protein
MFRNLKSSPSGDAFDPYAITRPSAVLMTYYALTSLLTGPLFPIVLLPLVFRYITLRYRFDDKGIAMSYGVVFKRETLLTYRRIQDIHLTHNIVQRWLGLATVSIQTASGAAGAEMAIEGILEAEALRDFLYQRMRGARGLDRGDVARLATNGIGTDLDSHGNAGSDEATALLRDIRDAMVALARREEERS